jgi:hypothetical protein
VKIAILSIRILGALALATLGVKWVWEYEQLKPEILAVRHRLADAPQDPRHVHVVVDHSNNPGEIANIVSDDSFVWVERRRNAGYVAIVTAVLALGASVFVAYRRRR